MSILRVPLLPVHLPRRSRPYSEAKLAFHVGTCRVRVLCFLSTDAARVFFSRRKMVSTLPFSGHPIDNIR